MLDGTLVIRQVADHFQLDSFSLIGHSWGAGMAVAFTATHPNRIKALITLDVRKEFCQSYWSNK